VETTNYIIFFKGFDEHGNRHFMLVHTFATNVTSNKSGYLLLISQAFYCLRNDVKNRGGWLGGGRKISKTIQILVIL
jgi:hypothetical protein